MTFEELRKVNQAVNNVIRYREDFSGRWQTPTETSVKGSGNCMDMAVLKYYRLHSLGVPADKMYIVIGNFIFPSGRQEMHAVLQIIINKQAYILDNRHSDKDSDDPITAKEYYRTKMPEIAYGINHKEWVRKPFE